MTVSVHTPGSPPEGSIWVVCDLRVASEAEVTACERRVLGSGASPWSSFWTTPPLHPALAVFELAERVYEGDRATIDSWISAQPELAEPRVVRAIMA